MMTSEPSSLGLGTGMAIFGSGVAWGIDRQSVSQLQGTLAKTAASAVFVPLTIARRRCVVGDERLA